MSDIPEVNDAKAEAANLNALSALQHSQETRAMLDEFMKRVNGVLNEMSFRLADMDRKHNLLLTKNFNHGSTSEE
jgi:hypothetical protein